MVEVGHKTEKNSRDLRRLAVTQTSVKDHQLRLDLQGVIIKIVNKESLNNYQVVSVNMHQNEI